MQDDSRYIPNGTAIVNSWLFTDDDGVVYEKVEISRNDEVIYRRSWDIRVRCKSIPEQFIRWLANKSSFENNFERGFKCGRGIANYFDRVQTLYWKSRAMILECRLKHLRLKMKSIDVKT